MALPPEVQEAENRMNAAKDALLADIESGQPYDAARRHTLIHHVERTSSEFVALISRLRPNP